MAARVPRTITGTGYTEGIPLVDSTILRIGMPSDWGSGDLQAEERVATGGTWRPLYDDEGQRVVIEAGASRTIRLDERLFQHAREVRFQSTVSQGGTRSLDIQTVKLSELVYGAPT